MNIKDEKIIVVTGGAGFIGSCVIKYLNDQRVANIVLVDDLDQTDKWKNLVGKQFREIVPIASCFDWLKGRESEIGAFIHLGACSSTVETNAEFLLNNNTRFSQKLSEYALKNNQTFIYASSAATYGDGSKGFSDSHESLETLQPLNMYGYSKHLFDLWLKQEGLLDQVVGLKYFNVFGPNEWHKGRMASAIRHILPSAINDGVIRLFKSSEPIKFADGEQCRDFIYVKDAVRMTCAFLNSDARGIFNIGSGRASTWNQLSNAVFKGINKPANIEYIDMPQDLRGKYQNYTCADNDKLKNALGDSANCIPLEVSVVDYVCEHLLPEKTW